MSVEYGEFVPAWKKIGLKLKRSTEDNPDVSVANLPPFEHGSKQQSSTGNHTITSQRETHVDDPVVVSNNTRENVSKVAPKKGIKASRSPQSTAARDDLPIRKRVKTVRFEAGTKLEDGEDLEDVSNDPDFFNLGVSVDGEQRRAKPRRAKTTSKEELREEEVATSKIASYGLSKAETPPTSQLAYLEDFVKNRKDWKFNKNHQTYLLKHVYDFDRIPVSCNDALYSYFSDLRGTDARARLKKEALAIVSKGSSSNDKRHDAEVDGTDGMASNSDSEGQSQQTRNRALRILQALKEDTVSSDESAESPEDSLPAMAKPAKKSRKKKIRGRKRRKR